MFLSSATGTFLRPDLPDNAAPRTAAVKTGRRPPAKPAQRGLDGREHGANLNQVGSAPVFKRAAPPEWWTEPTEPAARGVTTPRTFSLARMVGSPITAWPPGGHWLRLGFRMAGNLDLLHAIVV